MSNATDYLQKKAIENGLHYEQTTYKNKPALYKREEGYFLMERNTKQDGLGYKIVFGTVVVKFTQQDFNNYPQGGDYYNALFAAVNKIINTLQKIKI